MESYEQKKRETHGDGHRKWTAGNVQNNGQAEKKFRAITSKCVSVKGGVK